MLINEFLPNPDGKDADGEFIEFRNETSVVQDLSGWKIKDVSGKTFTFGDKSLGAGEYFILDYKISKISLNNNGESLFLYDAFGNLKDKAEYSGTAEAGKSLVQIGGKFVWSDSPTPGKENILPAQEESESLALISSVDYGNGNLIANISRDNHFGNIFIGISISFVLAIIFIITLYKLKELETADEK